MKPGLTREQHTTLIYSVMFFLLLVLVLQLWLLTATMNSFMGGDHGMVFPAALASFLCFSFNALLLRILKTRERSWESTK